MAARRPVNETINSLARCEAPSASPTWRMSFQTSEIVWFEGQNDRLRSNPSAKRLLQIARSDRADGTLRLGQNQVRPQLAKVVDVDAVNREAFSHDFLHLLIDFIR